MTQRSSTPASGTSSSSGFGVLQFALVVFVVSTTTAVLGIGTSGDFAALTAGLVAAATILNGGMPKDN